MCQIRRLYPYKRTKTEAHGQVAEAGVDLYGAITADRGSSASVGDPAASRFPSLRLVCLIAIY